MLFIPNKLIFSKKAARLISNSECIYAKEE